MSTSEGMARAVLDLLVDGDLIEIESHDDAVAKLTAAIEGAASDDLVSFIADFLDEDEVIDEIYGTDGELKSAIKKALAQPAA